MLKGISCLKYIFLLALVLCTSFNLRARNTDGNSILIITSYNPDIEATAETISAFVDECKKRDKSIDVTVESMNIQNLSEIFSWKDRMDDILHKYEESAPSAVVLLGQEAWSSFLSQKSEFVRTVPSFCGMVSLRTVLLPEKSVSCLNDWEPENLNITDLSNEYNIIGGYVNNYDVASNIGLIKRLFPHNKKIWFLSDNTFGGVCMQSNVRKYASRHKDIQIDYIDGRKKTFFEVNEKINHIPFDNTLLIGTWRIDSTENYVLKNTISLLCDDNPKLPTFSLSSVGLGHWAIGGYIPNYRPVGKNLADLTCDFILGRLKGKRAIHILSNKYVFDSKRLSTFNVDYKAIPTVSSLINVEPTFYQKNKDVLNTVIIIFLVLLVIIVIAIYYILKINKLKHHLELSAVELVDAKEKAEEANKLKSSFLANMSHEIRTPLNAIVGFSGVLTTEELSPEDKEQYCNIINKNSDLLLHLINDILDISRMESGIVIFEKSECDIVEICKTAMTTVECANKTKAAFRFETNIESLKLYSDASRLRQVVINLLTNAAKFTPEGEILLTLSAKNNNEVEVAVQDTGCGIPKQKSEAVFNRFEKLSEYSQGTGLGLAICRLIIDNLGGKIWLDTDYTKGARFVFAIPVHKN